MPIFTGNEPGVLVGVDRHDFRVALKPGHATMDRQFAEGAAEFLVADMIEVLVTKEDDLMLHQRGVQLVDNLVRERFGKVDAIDLRANPRRHRPYRQDFIIHRPGPALYTARCVVLTLTRTLNKSCAKRLVRERPSI